MSEEKGIGCVKGYGTISFVKSGDKTRCPISGTSNCVRCNVITYEEAAKQKQVRQVTKEEA